MAFMSGLPVGVHGKAAVLAIILLLFIGSPAYAVMYKVGDSSGWTTIGNVDYSEWAATKTFRLGDVIVFQYNQQFHNVMQVRHAAYRTCNASLPIETHTTGNDTITITRHGHYFFLCGTPGHCQAGQKVDIHVHKSIAVSIAPSPSIASSPTSAAMTTPLGPSSDATTLGNPLKWYLCAQVAATTFLVNLLMYLI